MPTWAPPASLDGLSGGARRCVGLVPLQERGACHAKRAFQPEPRPASTSSAPVLLNAETPAALGTTDRSVRGYATWTSRLQMACSRTPHRKDCHRMAKLSSALVIWLLHSSHYRRRGPRAAAAARWARRAPAPQGARRRAAAAGQPGAPPAPQRTRIENVYYCHPITSAMCTKMNAP